MNRKVKAVFIVIAILLIIAGCVISCNDNAFISFSMVFFGCALLYVVKLFEKRTSKIQKGKIIIDGRYIRIDFNNHSYRIINSPSDFEVVLKELEDKQQEVNNGKV